MLKTPPPTAAATSSAKKSVYPLRRATYVSIEKLVNSQYNLDANRFDVELAKLRSGNDAASGEEKENVGTITSPTVTTATAPARTGTGTPTSCAATGMADLHIEQKAAGERNAWANPLTALPSSWPQSSQVLPPAFFKSHNQSNRLQPPRDGFNLCVLVGKVDIVVDKVRVDGSRVLVAEVKVGDNTGSISLRARDDQIDMLKEISKDKGAVVLRNCTVELHQRKFLRLAVSKWGKMKAYPDGIGSTPDPPLSMNIERNFSLVDLNTVATIRETNASQSSMTKQQQHHKHQHHVRGHTFEEKRSPGYYQRNTNRKYQQQQQRREQQPSMYSPQRQYYPQQQQTQGAAVPVYFPPYTSGDAGSVYSYQSHSTERSSPPPGQRLYHHPSYQTDHFSQQQHQQLMYQQYELQQRHAHQMQMLQETQRRIMAVEHQRLGGHPSQRNVPINMVESHESNEDYSIPSTIAMAPQPLQGGVFPPPPPPPPLPPNVALAPPMGYPYSPSTVPSPMRSVLPPLELAGNHDHQAQHVQASEEPASSATVVSPPVSPPRFGQVQPPACYGDQLLYFDQSSIPLTGMQDQNDQSPGANDEQNDENNIQF